MTKNKHLQNERQMGAPLEPTANVSRECWLRFAKLKRNLLGWLRRWCEDIALYLRSRVIPAAKRVVQFGRMRLPKIWRRFRKTITAAVGFSVLLWIANQYLPFLLRSLISPLLLVAGLVVVSCFFVDELSQIPTAADG